MKRNLITILLVTCFILVLLACVTLRHNMSLSKQVDQDADLSAQEEPSPVQNEEDRGSELTPANETLHEAAVDFTMMDRYGEEHKLSEFFGKPMILNFWATWCGPCQMELPYFDEANALYQDQIQFLMIDLADGAYETREGAIAFAENKGYSFPLYFDELGEASSAFQITAIPLTIVMDADGGIIDSHLGTMSSEELQVLIDKVLN